MINDMLRKEVGVREMKQLGDLERLFIAKLAVVKWTLLWGIQIVLEDFLELVHFRVLLRPLI